MLRDGLQTISCEQCEELHDVPLTAGFVNRYIDGDRGQSMEDHFATLSVVCPVEAWHTVHFWAHVKHWARRDGEEIIARCPRCGGHMSEGGTHVIYN
jgi:hypothetical protein